MYYKCLHCVNMMKVGNFFLLLRLSVFSFIESFCENFKRFNKLVELQLSFYRYGNAARIIILKSTMLFERRKNPHFFFSDFLRLAGFRFFLSFPSLHFYFLYFFAAFLARSERNF